MKFPTKANRPGEIPAYTKAGLGRVPETRLDQYNLPKAANIGDAWKEVVGTGTKLYQQYSKMQSEMYMTEMSPKLAEMVMQVHDEAVNKFNPADTKQNYTQQVTGYMDQEIEKRFFTSSEFIKESETEANAALRKEYIRMRTEYLPTDFTTMAAARKKQALENVTQACQFAGTSAILMFNADMNTSSNILAPDYVDENGVGYNKVPSAKGYPNPKTGRIENYTYVPRNFTSLGAAVAKDEEMRQEIIIRNFKAGVISHDDFITLSKEAIRESRKQMFQAVLDKADTLLTLGDYDGAIALYSQVEQAVPFIETRVIYDPKLPGGAHVDYFWGADKTDQDYAAWDANIEKHGSADGVIAKTTRSSILTPDEQHTYINTAKQKAASARAAKAKANLLKQGQNYISKEPVREKIAEPTSTAISSTYGKGAAKEQIEDRNKKLRGM